MEAASSSKTLATVCKLTWFHILEDHIVEDWNLQQRRYENFIPCMAVTSSAYSKIMSC